MNEFKFFPLVLKNILRNKRRTLLTVLSIGVSIFLLTTILTVTTTMNARLNRPQDSPRLVVHHKTALSHPLPEAYRDRIAQVPGVTHLTAMVFFGGVYRDPKELFANFAIEAETFTDIFPEFDVTPTDRAAFIKEKTGAVVGESLMKQFSWHYGDQITLHGTLYPVDLTFNIVGVHHSTINPSSFLFRREYFEESMKNPGIANSFWLKVDAPTAIGRVSKMIDDMFANSPAETKTETESSFFMGFQSMMGNIQGMVSGIGLIVAATTMLVAANSIAMSVRERTTEIGVLKALGFRRQAILRLILAESTFMSFLGGVAGTVAAYLFFSYRGINLGFLPFGEFVVTLDVVTKGIVIAVMIGFLSGVIPAWQASELKVVEALRKIA